ncbi:hypothetical protein QOZ80_2BG0165820 [Eleusine coracana subsp. coracana]|nr:hypothetical protein QOZ80_2BG0165820 [Eleusine coracana subsp. coracana]
MENMHDVNPEVVEVAEQQPEVQGGAAHGRLQWTNVMSGFVLRRFCDLVADGVKIDKGFKEVHLNAVARDLREFIGQEVTGTQVYNHMRKWRARWVKICRLKDLSGAGWDEDNFMITLDPDHYHGHIKPLINYTQMQIIFATGVATGRFAMGSNEPLDTQPGESIDLDCDAPYEATTADTCAAGAAAAGSSAARAATGSSGAGKRKMTCQDEVIMTKLTEAIWGFATAVAESAHSEAAPGIYQSIMGCTTFSREALMFALGHLMDHKATALVFIQMNEEDKDLWLRTYLNQHYY